MEKEIEYETLRLDVLQKLIDLRSLPYKIYKKEKDTKNAIIELLKQDDAGKYLWETTYEKSEGGFIVGIDIKNQKQILEITKLIDKKEARRLDRYCDNRLQYWSSQKLIS
jgi:cytoplasmic iron level regulating protein YaaA (DUF328/UPF0246 family)